MATGDQRLNGSWRGLGLAISLALLLLAGSAVVVWRELELLLPNNRIVAAVQFRQALGSTLGWQLASFTGAVLLAHLAFGLLIFGLARLTEAALPVALSVHREWLIAVWFLLASGLVWAANATLYPASIFAGEVPWLHSRTYGLYAMQIAAIVMGITVIGIAALAFRRMRPRSRHIAIAAVAAIALAVLGSATQPPLRKPAPSTAETAPHVVIVGIDSLRSDLSLPRLGPAALPHVEAFLGGARRFTDATTPLARTFGSWVSILTGRNPVSTRARVNLMPRDLVVEGETLADVLRTRGYRTTYATDEARFANIDGTYGFDQLITPPIGAVDPLLTNAGDMPLINLLASTPGGSHLFPSNHANRAANVVYEPADFVRRVERELEVDRPSLIAIHLTLAHWPYSWAGMTVPGTPQEYRIAYRRAIEKVDDQFDAVMRLLAAKGVLDNAFVVLLSDHGEALGAQTDSMLRETGTHLEIWHSLWGHGTSVMSPNQYQVLLAMRAYGRARLPGPELDYDWPVSLEDLRPTLEQVVTGTSPTGVDGISLVPYFQDPSRATALTARVRFTETDFNTRDTLAGRYQPPGVIDQAAEYYELDPRSGWIQFRRERLPELLAQKQRAAFSSNTLLAAIPGPPGRGPSYLLTDRHKPKPKALEGPPEPAADPEARRLWDALQRRYPGELRAAANLP